MASLVPCTATATSFLYAEQNSVVCCCRKTLAFERLFGRHSDTVTLLVSNPTRNFVVSCDREAAIVWNPESGEEKNRFPLPERITATAWMKNGNVILGSYLGKIFLFNPDTGSSDFKLTLDNEITAIAPAFVLGSWIFAVGLRTPLSSVLKTAVEDTVVASQLSSHLEWLLSAASRFSDDTPPARARGLVLADSEAYLEHV
ncbi:hypothetical protein SPBR_09196 [Sporothrix brasiliensis 5110]|uniref:Uncharacterized protein n=1 Tax=Sporothrix brasiliensis 5110 TaxID=1398154 RepID=A0A0C2JBJ3_9PEZI|nr:uncharacterized protein SPBR_09196 [Sporothrix brasiliensis 5110]KIH94237.1 hypothetical protein SPBR_09196 [Sporothrix brasiliensis 5110]